MGVDGMAITLTVAQAQALRVICNERVEHCRERLDMLNEELAFWAGQFEMAQTLRRELAVKIDQEIRKRS